jgi:hypothetical protein
LEELKDATFISVEFRASGAMVVVEEKEVVERSQMSTSWKEGGVRIGVHSKSLLQS